MPEFVVCPVKQDLKVIKARACENIHLTELFNCINDKYKLLKFIFELENNRCLSFNGLIITRNNNSFSMLGIASTWRPKMDNLRVYYIYHNKKYSSKGLN